MIIMSSYENQAMLDAMNNGDILRFATQWPVMEGRISIDLAVRAFEGKELIDYIYTEPVVITKETAGSIDMTAVLAPADWQPVYKVD
jgi:protein TorT